MASRNISISLPEEMIRQADQLAADEHRTVSELFREAFRSYQAQQVRRSLDEARRYARTRNQSQYAEQDVVRLSKEVRAETSTQRAKRSLNSKG
jgi:metal-responsive CopG/Arc/MetJ family transcriptional regulator